MNPTDTTFERFTSAIGDKIREITGLEDVYYERSRHAGFPRVIYTATVWTNNDALRGTLTCTISGNTAPSEVDHIAHTLLHELEGFSCFTEELTWYLYNCRSVPLEDSDKSVFIRVFTSEFFVIGD